jgi:hypothetical protein
LTKIALYTRNRFCDTPATFPDTFPYLFTAMDHILQKSGWRCPVVWLTTMAAVVCLGLAGCSRLNSLRGDGFHDNSMGDAIRQSQAPPKKPQEFWSFSNKARQIEADFPDP